MSFFRLIDFNLALTIISLSYGQLFQNFKTVSDKFVKSSTTFAHAVVDLKLDVELRISLPW